MNEKKLTEKQFGALIITSLLSPLLRSLPRAVVHTAEQGAWLSVVPAFFVLMALAAFSGYLIRRLGPEEGYGQLLLRWLGPVGGRAVLCIYGLWFLVYAGFVLRSGADRLVSAVYPESPQLPFMAVTLGLCLILALGTLRATGRTAFLLKTVLLSALGLVLLFAAPNVSVENLLPVPWYNISGILIGSLPLLSIGGLAATFPFLMGYVEPISSPGRKGVHLALFHLFLALILCLEVVGTFGPALTEKLTYPFFLMVRDISVFRITQRIEAVVVVIWMLADFILCAAMLRCAFEVFRCIFSLPDPEQEPVFSLRGGRWILWLEAGAVLAAALWITNPSFRSAALSDVIIPLAGSFTIYILLPLCWFIGFLRGRT